MTATTYLRTSDAAAYGSLVELDTILRRARPGRVGWIDGARGLSIAAMIVSHASLTFDLLPAWFHVVVMRPVAPMFLLLLGMLWRPGFRRRHVQFAGALVASQLFALTLGFAVPNIFVVMGICLLLMRLAVRWPVATVVLCVNQLVFWPLPDWWSGYPLGFALLLVLLGHLIPADGFMRAYGNLGQRLGLTVVGRYPMTFYLGHLLVLVLVSLSPSILGGGDFS